MRSLLRYSILSIGIIVVTVLGLVGVLSVTRTNTVRHVIAVGDAHGPPHPSDPLFMRSMELFTGTAIEPGNRVSILLDGNGTFPPLLHDLAAATQTITMQMYYAEPGGVVDTVSRSLIERSRAGVRVLLLLDAFGAQPLKASWIRALRAAHVEVAWLRPLKWYTLHRAAQRSHVRAVVIDGRVGYTGGFGLADYWLGDGHHFRQWRETNVRFEGPAVAALQGTFAAGWAEATGELLTGDVFFPPSAFRAVGSVNAGLMHTSPTIGSTPAERFLALSIAAARRTLYITNSYFVPDDDFRRMLVLAAQRGVDVRVVTAGHRTDVKTTLYAGRAYYEELLRAGIRIYEYEPTMMHAKSFVVDGIWSCVGSMNFDNRSLSFNNESVLVALDSAVGHRMNEIFLDDVRYAKEITLPEFRRRSLFERLLERGAELLWRIL